MLGCPMSRRFCETWELARPQSSRKIPQTTYDAKTGARSTSLFIHPFACVRTYANATIAAVIANNPRDAPPIDCTLLGKIDTRPYTNSMCTQYTSNDACPN